jgi:predicted Fe-S protein YdhL (DUF1289 family)
MTAAARHVRRQWLRLVQLPPDEAVPSPCNNVCRIDADSGLCEGCLRTLDEIGDWGVLDEQEKLVVWQRLKARASDALSPNPIPGGEGANP